MLQPLGSKVAYFIEIELNIVFKCVLTQTHYNIISKNAYGVVWMLRFAPSPTHDLTIDELRAAIVSFVVARQRQEPFLIRIDDADKAHVIEGKDTEIMQILEKFSIAHEQLFHLSEHANIHLTLALQLLKEKKAYLCTCTAATRKETEETPCRADCDQVTGETYTKLKEDGTPFVIRLKAPQSAVTFHDLYRGTISTEPDAVGETVILHADATPGCDFASAAEDMLNDIGLVIRPESLLARTPVQEYIKQQLGCTIQTRYAHLPPFLPPKDETDLPTLKSLFEEGYIPDAIINYLLLAGNPKAPKPVFTLPEAIEWFELEALTPKSEPFDMETLRYLNREHLLRMDDRRLSTLFGFADAAIGKLAKVYLEAQKASTVSELETYVRAIFTPKEFECEAGEAMRSLSEIIWNAPMIDSYDEFISHLGKESGMGEAQMLPPLRLLLTGTNEGPELEQIYPHIKSYLLEVIS